MINILDHLCLASTVTND